MPRQRHEARLEWPIRTTFAALVGVLAKGRWARDYLLEPDTPVPRAGQRYEQQRPTVLRRGRVVECIPPVSITLCETLFDPPCRVQLRMRWRLEPVQFVSFLRLDASFDFEGAATLRRRHWNTRIHAYCTRLLGALEGALASLEPGQDVGSGVNGQSRGSSTITVTKMVAASGKPTLR
jgi:hypothetical protein